MRGALICPSTVLSPGNVRNDFYVTLLQGEFDRGKKKTPKNVEVILSVHDDEGNPMEVNWMSHFTLAARLHGNQLPIHESADIGYRYWPFTNIYSGCDQQPISDTKIGICM